MGLGDTSSEQFASLEKLLLYICCQYTKIQSMKPALEIKERVVVFLRTSHCRVDPPNICKEANFCEFNRKCRRLFHLVFEHLGAFRRLVK